MFKSIFTKYITVFMLIIVASFLMLAAIVGTMIVDYYTENSRDKLASVANSSGAVLEDRLGDMHCATLAEYLDTHADEAEAYLSALVRMNDDVAILLCDTEGRILFSVGFPDNAFADNDTVPANILAAARAGGYVDNGNLDGLLPARYAVHGIEAKAGGLSIGGVFACSTSRALDNLIRTTIKAIIMTCLWVLLAALIAVYFISEKITGPLRAMSRAAKSFASGKLDVRVPVKGNDEIAELSLAFNNMATSLADLENMRSTFLSNVSHDLRTPMTTISGFIDGLLDGTIPEEKREYYLRVIGDEVRRLSRLVAAILDVSRLQAGDRKFTSTAFDICEMARVILISFEQKIDKKRLDVEFDVESDNLYAWADRDAIYQILYNICDNGVKFAREGGKYRLRITEKDRRLYVSVYNEGQGLRPEELPQVFERFYKSDKSRSLDKTGVGLGLYICKQIIDAHNEEIWVKSKYGEYCEFLFTLKKATDSQVKKTFEKQLPED